MITNKDLAFIGSWWTDKDLPKNKQYLYKYFKTDVQREFLGYYFLFGYKDYKHFAECTGHLCTAKWIKSLHKRVLILENAYAEAKEQVRVGGNFDDLMKIESGKYKLPAW